jgi:hypothetical protein
MTRKGHWGRTFKIQLSFCARGGHGRPQVSFPLV